MKEIVKLIPTGRKILVEQVAYVNKIPYFVEGNNPEKVYTLLEIWRPKKKQPVKVCAILFVKYVFLLSAPKRRGIWERDS